MIILLDHDLEGQVPFLEAGWRETGWDQYLPLEFRRLRDLNVPDNATDQEVWRYVQCEYFLLLTNNRCHSLGHNAAVRRQEQISPQAVNPDC